MQELNKKDLKNMDLNLIPDNIHEWLMDIEDVASVYDIRVDMVIFYINKYPDGFNENEQFVKINKIMFLTKDGVLILGLFLKSDSAKKFRKFATFLTYKDACNNEALNNTPVKFKVTKLISDPLSDLKKNRIPLINKTSISLSDLVELLEISYDRNSLFSFLREQKILKDDNTPFFEYLTAGYFEVLDVDVFKPTNQYNRTVKKTHVYPVGVDFIYNLLLDNNMLPEDYIYTFDSSNDECFINLKKFVTNEHYGKLKKRTKLTALSDRFNIWEYEADHLKDDISIEQFSVLKKKLDSVNEKIQRMDVEKSYKTDQLKKILNQHGVKSVSELKKLRDEKSKEANEVFNNANTYLSEVSLKLSEADSLLHK